MVKDKPEYRQYLDANGVKYDDTVNTYLDPAPAKEYPTYDVLVILPANYNLGQPWDDGLNKYIKEVKPIGIQQGDQFQIFAAIYSVNLN